MQNNNQNVMNTKEMEILKYCNVRQYFTRKGEQVKAVHNVSFNILNGEVFGLVGEQGCGKSTIGKSIIRSYHILDGDIIINNQRVCAGLRTKKRAIQKLKQNLKDQKIERNKLLKICKGEKPTDDVKNISYLENHTEILQIKGQYNQFYDQTTRTIENIKLNIVKANDDNNQKAPVLQRVARFTLDELANINGNLTVNDIVNQSLKNVGVTNREDINRALQDILRVIGFLPEQAFKKYQEFDEAEQQKIRLAKVLACKPLLIIIDEAEQPLSNTLKIAAFNLIKLIKDNYKVSTLFITNNIYEAKELCDRIGIMYFGRLVEIAKAPEIISTPLHPYTKSLVSKQQEEVLYYNPSLRVYSVDKPVMTKLCEEHFVYASKGEAAQYQKQLKGEKTPLDPTLTTAEITLDELRNMHKTTSNQTVKNNVQIVLERKRR